MMNSKVITALNNSNSNSVMATINSSALSLNALVNFARNIFASFYFMFFYFIYLFGFPETAWFALIYTYFG